MFFLQTNAVSVVVIVTVVPPVGGVWSLVGGVWRLVGVVWRLVGGVWSVVGSEVAGPKHT